MCTRHVLALLRRNFIYRKRKWFSSFVELVIPALSILILVLIKTALDDDPSFKPTLVDAIFPTNDDVVKPLSFGDYLTAIESTKVCVPTPTKKYRRGRSNDFLISGILPSQWPVPFVKCNSLNCEKAGNATKHCDYHVLAVAPADQNSVGHVESFKDYLIKSYPQLMPLTQSSSTLGMGLQDGLEIQTVQNEVHPLVLNFTSNEEIENYIVHQEYGEIGKPKIALAVILGGSNNQFQYTIRANATNFNSEELTGRPVMPTHPSTQVLLDSFAKTPTSVCTLEQGTTLLGPHDQTCHGQYMYNGAIVIQRLVNDWIIDTSGAKSTGTYVAENGVSFVPFPSKEYVEDGFYAEIGPYAPLLLVLGLLFPVAQSIRSLVTEKENRSKELMKMMSISESSIGRAWFISIYGFFFISGVLSTIASSFLYSESSPLALFIFWELSFIAVTMFIFVISAVSTKATRGTLVGVLLFFVGYFLTLVTSFDTGRRGIISLVSLHPVTAISYGIQVIGSLEDSGVGLKRSTLRFSDNPSRYTFLDTLRSLLLDIFLWGVYSWYLNRVLKGDYGAAQPWYFPFSKNYWCGKSESDDEQDLREENYDSIPAEPVSSVLRSQEKEGKAVILRGLSKVFNEKTAVNNLDLSMYSGQVFALLGHNGAGKTTTINMLTGMVVPSSGYASVVGKNIMYGMDDIRKDVGVCLQHDCLFPLLTVKEHLQFFGRVKGLYEDTTFEEAEASIETALKDVALLEKKNTFSKDLSGGMKRKLSVAIAFCGNSKVVFLDEPTSGMDAFSRRFTWNLIRQYREDRCIILTTHFMEEADLLGDRIGIMAEGELRCVGSSLFLKKKYGVGYQLTIEKLPMQTNSNRHQTSMKLLETDISSLVTNTVNDATLLSNVGTEMSFQLPIGESDKFPEIFESLDEKVSNRQVVTYGVSITTMESVFLMVAQGKVSALKEDSLNQDIQPIGNKPVSFRPDQNSSQAQIFSRHVSSLIYKRVLNFKRDKKAWFCSVILPSLFALFGFLLVSFNSSFRDMPALELKLSDYNTVENQNPIPYNNASTFSCQPGKCISQSQFNLNFVDGSNEAYYFCGDRNQLNTGVQCTITESSDIAGYFEGGFPLGQDVSNVSEASLQLPSNPEEFGFSASQYGAIYFTHDESSDVVGGAYDGLSYKQAMEQKCASTEVTIGDSYCDLYGGIGYVVATNFTALHASLLYQSIADESIIREALNDDTFSIKTTVHPLPLTKTEENLGQAQDSYSAWFLLVLSFPFITGSFATFLVQERMSKAKHLQTVAGVKPSAYWISTYIWDILNYQLPMWVIIVLMFAFSVDAFTTSDRGVLGGTILSLLVYGPASAGFTYCLSYIFKSPSACNAFVIVFNFFIGLTGPLVSLILRFIDAGNGDDGTDFKGIAVIIEWCLRPIPSFNLSKSLLFMINIDTFALIGNDPDLTVWSKEVILIEFIFLCVQSVFYILLAILIDKVSTKPKASQLWKTLISCGFCCGRKKNVRIYGNGEEDSDVLRESERVTSGGADGDLIIMKSLEKTYPGGKLAVNNLSLGIPPGQCFGLLGVNGAGKTTTMSMLTAEFPPSAGDAILAGYSVTTNPEKTRQEIGFCPQFDAHFTNMTGREHVSLYASIKGVPRPLVNEAVTKKLDEIGLNEEDRDRLSSKYSGGMKRKLSVACATIGDPQIVFLDEPSTGMDPVARRALWKVISNMVLSNDREDSSRKTSVILTTHSMEECEALCPRLGIMAAGNLRCLGSAQHLKSKFGKGFQIELTISEVQRSDRDFMELLPKLGSDKYSNAIDIEEGVDSDNLYLNLPDAKSALDSIAGNNSFSSKLTSDDPVGYTILRSAESEAGVSLSELAAFCVKELRIEALCKFFEEKYPGSILRERQDTKLRFEVSSDDTKISELFRTFRDEKDVLWLSDYGISQTSLEQVFIMHASEAEKAKEGTTD